jgi:enoyl-CoA hydratase/carnithine racemase
LQMFLAAEKLSASEALSIGLIDAIAEDPVAAAAEWIGKDWHEAMMLDH